MHALRTIQRALVRGGILLDMHPIPPSTRAQVRGEILGEFDDAEFLGIVRTTEGLLADCGLFALDAELEFDWLERFDSAEDLLEDVALWEGCRTPRGLAARIREAAPPIDVWERAVLRRFRAR